MMAFLTAFKNTSFGAYFNCLFLCWKLVYQRLIVLSSRVPFSVALVAPP